MCGIFGLITKKNSSIKKNKLKLIFKNLSNLSESRGRDSSGVCFKNNKNKEFKIIKSNQKITSLVKEDKFKELFNEHINENNFNCIGHSRLVTNGSQLKSINNQPVVNEDIIAIHNGIIVNDDELFKKFKLNRNYQIDTEVLINLISKFMKFEKLSPLNATIESLRLLKGTYSNCFMFKKFNKCILTTNNGSLYYTLNNDFLIFASENYILEKTLENSFGKKNGIEIKKLNPNTLIAINLENFKSTFQSLDSKNDIFFSCKLTEYKSTISSIDINEELDNVIDIEEIKLSLDYHKKKSFLEYNIDRISKIKRCTRCILPSTFPFIKFDEKGVCNYCNNYVKRNQLKPLSKLKDLVKPYLRTNNKLDCLVPFSGGRDSTYVLHYVKEELGLNPIAYTYDWGMVTDLARRNIARVCGKLNVENIIVAADIKKKRRNIRLNIKAWLKNPDLGMIPLFMAGDKQFFKYANIIKSQCDIKLNIWGINFLENTDFKVGFCNVPPEWDKEMIYSMNIQRKLKLYSHVLKNIIKNPAYLNVSLFDTFESFISRYMNPRKDYYHFFDFHQWNEEEIEKILKEEYKWETSKDLKSTWRIGDGTASFYNYIYYTVAGFSEFDTFRSNQIREGMISRDGALNLVNEENIPRYDSLRWYHEIIGLDFESTIKKINGIKKLY